MSDISPKDLEALHRAFAPLIGLRITWLSIPGGALLGFEPSQIAVIVNTLLDGILPQIQFLASDEENRETYPDYVHVSGRRVELKGLFIDNPELALKRPPTDREPSARLKENVTMDIIDPANDALLVAAVQLRPDEGGLCSPYVIDIGVFSMVECVRARDASLAERGGKWIDGTPKVVKKSSMGKFRAGDRLQNSDFEKDTNFGKLKRIPYPPLQEFMRKHGAI